jgi:hypothetical protein
MHVKIVVQWRRSSAGNRSYRTPSVPITEPHDAKAPLSLAACRCRFCQNVIYFVTLDVSEAAALERNASKVVHGALLVAVPTRPNLYVSQDFFLLAVVCTVRTDNFVKTPLVYLRPTHTWGCTRCAGWFSKYPRSTGCRYHYSKNFQAAVKNPPP